MTPGEMHGLGYRIIVDPITPLLAAFEAMKGIYDELAGDFAVRSRPPEAWHGLQDSLHSVIELEKLLAIEKETVEK